MKAIITLRDGSASAWTARNPVLKRGEPGFEVDTNRLKIGDGVRSWADLDYISGEVLQGDSAYQVAVDNGFVGTEAEWLESLQGQDGEDGTNGLDGVDGVDGDPGPAGPAGETYPLSGYGFHSASIPIETARSDSNHGPAWVTRVWVPAGKAINSIGMFVSSGSGSTPGSGNNAFAIYDDSGNFVASTTPDNNLWTADHDWNMKALPAPIAAESSGRFVYVVSFHNGGTDPNVAYLNIGFGEKMFRGGITSHYRSFVTSYAASFPSTIDVASGGSNFGFLPLVVLA